MKRYLVGSNFELPGISDYDYHLEFSLSWKLTFSKTIQGSGPLFNKFVCGSDSQFVFLTSMNNLEPSKDQSCNKSFQFYSVVTDKKKIISIQHTCIVINTNNWNKPHSPRIGTLLGAKNDIWILLTGIEVLCLCEGKTEGFDNDIDLHFSDYNYTIIWHITLQNKYKLLTIKSQMIVIICFYKIYNHIKINKYGNMA